METKLQFLVGPVINCFVKPPNTKLEKTAKNESFALRRLAHKFAAGSRSTT